MTGRTKAKRGGFRSAYSKKRSSPDEGDAPPRASKKAKGDDEEDESATLVPKLQKDEQGDSYVALKSNGMRRVTVSEFKGKTLIHIREFYQNDAGKTLPGKKGISLTLDQYNAFVAALPLLESAITKRGDKVVRPDFNGQAAAAEAQSPDDEAEEEPEEQEQDDDEEDE